jgi:hypothetical protein
MNVKSKTILLLAALIMLLMFSGPVAATKAGDACSFISPCNGAFSCQPIIQKCYNSPRREGQPCSAGFSCGAGLRCVAGSQRCVSANTGPTGILEQSAASAANAANAAAAAAADAATRAANAAAAAAADTAARAANAAAAAAARSRAAEQEQTYARDPEPSQAQIEANQRADYEAQMRAEQQANQQAQYEAQARAQAEANQRAQQEANQRAQYEAQAEADQRARQEEEARVQAQRSNAAQAYPTFSFKSYAYPDKFIRHGNYLGYVTQIIDVQGGKDASFRYLPGLAGKCTSFEAINFPGYFLRHQGFRLKLAARENSQLYNEDATFCVVQGLANPDHSSMESVNYPGYFITQDEDFALWLRQPDGTDQFRRYSTFTPTEPFQRN